MKKLNLLGLLSFLGAAKINHGDTSLPAVHRDGVNLVRPKVRLRIPPAFRDSGTPPDVYGRRLARLGHGHKYNIRHRRMHR